MPSNRTHTHRLLYSTISTRCTAQSRSPSPPGFEHLPTCSTSTFESRRPLTALLRPNRSTCTAGAAASDTKPLAQPRASKIDQADQYPEEETEIDRSCQESSIHNNSSVGDGSHRVLVQAKLCRSPTGTIDSTSPMRDHVGFTPGDCMGRGGVETAHGSRGRFSEPALGNKEYLERRRKRAARGAAILRQLGLGFGKIDTL